MTNSSKLIGSLAAGGAALLTGRNHHSSHMGRFNDDKFGTPGYDTYLPSTRCRDERQYDMLICSHWP